jgi:hypothetical protein
LSSIFRIILDKIPKRKYRGKGVDAHDRHGHLSSNTLHFPGPGFFVPADFRKQFAPVKIDLIALDFSLPVKLQKADTLSRPAAAGRQIPLPRPYSSSLFTHPFSATARLWRPPC